MTKQLIALIGALVTVGIVAAAVLIGVVPLVGGVFSATAQREQVTAVNAGYEAQIATLSAEQERLGEIQEQLVQLRARIPERELLNQVFERISRAEAASGVHVVAASRGDLTPYAVRTGTGEDAPPAAATPPAETAAPPADATAPIAAAGGAAAQANANVTATDGATGAEGTGGAATPDAATSAAPTASARQQVELSIRVTAPDIGSAFAFLDALRAGPRAIAIDTATTTRTTSGFDMQITAIAFLHSDGGE